MTFLSFEHAALNTVADYPGGARALGQAVGINGSVLAHKVRLQDADNQLTVPQARKIMLATGDYRMLHALAADLDHLCIQVEGLSGAETLERSIADAAKEFGEYLSAVSTAMLDGQVTTNELRKIDRELSDLVSRANSLRALCAAHMPRPQGKTRS